MQTAQTDMPWVIYSYGRTHDLWWPVWNSTRVLGRSCIVCECCVCGDVTPLWMKIPRFGPIPEPEGGMHPKRRAYLKAHLHPEKGAPMSWARPLRNMNVFSEGLPLDQLAMRLEADINEDRCD